MSNEAPENIARTEEPRAQRWREQLNLKSGDTNDDATIARLEAIAWKFSNLRLPVHAFPPAEREAVFAQARQDFLNHSPEQGVGLVEGIDYFFGRYKGNPSSIRQNAEAALFQGRQGVELWRVMKSVAFSTPDEKLVVAHVRGDRQVSVAALAEKLGLRESDLTNASPELLSELGVEYGTVNPFIIANDQVEHVFDRDLVGGEDYPNDDMVMTSSGDKRIYVGFDVRKYLMALSKLKAIYVTSEISSREAESPRVVARRPIVVIGGDSGLDTSKFGQSLMLTVTRTLEDRHAYFGDRSLPRIRVESSPQLAGSIDTGLYDKELRKCVVQMAARLEKPNPANGGPKPIVTFNSMAMHGIAGDIMSKESGVEYIGPKEAVENLLAEFEARGIKIAQTVLLGLDSVYDSKRSAFAGKILGIVAPLDSNAKRQVREFVDLCKLGKSDSQKFTGMIKKVLSQVVHGPEDVLKSKNVAIILGASELERFVASDYQGAANYLIVRSTDPTVIATQIAEAPADKIRLIFIQPGQAVVDLIAKKTLGLGD